MQSAIDASCNSTYNVPVVFFPPLLTFVGFCVRLYLRLLFLSFSFLFFYLLSLRRVVYKFTLAHVNQVSFLVCPFFIHRQFNFSWLSTKLGPPSVEKSAASCVSTKLWRPGSIWITRFWFFRNSERPLSVYLFGNRVRSCLCDLRNTQLWSISIST